MTIGIDARLLLSAKSSGIEEYTKNLLSHMLPLDRSIRFKLFYSGIRYSLPEYDWMNGDNVEIVHVKIPNRLLFASSRFIGRPYLDKLIKGADVFFSPHFYIAPLSPLCKHVVTFHDLSFVHHPQFFSFNRNMWNNFGMNPYSQALKADSIISISQSTADDLVKKYNLDTSKINIIHSGIPEKFKKIESRKILKEVKAKYNLPEKFIFYLGTIEPRKNISGIVEAFEIIKRDIAFEDYHLVIAGSRGWLYKNIFKKIGSSQFRTSIRYLGDIEDNDRPALYNLAQVLVYPSFFEGFGFQPLEAMACRTPVIASNVSSIPEVVHDAAILIDPYNIKELYSAIRSVLTEEELRESMIEKGEERVKNFSWHKCAEKTLSVLTEVI